MLPALVTLDANLREILPETTTAVPRARLARELKAAYDVAMIEAGRSGWRTPDLLPIDALLARRYGELADAGWAGAERVLLSRDAFRIAAERAAPDEDLARHVELFMTAWGLAHEWHLFGHAAQLQQTENSRAFLDWASRFERQCREQGWITTPELPAALALSAREGTALPRRLALVGVDRLPPARSAWIEALGAAGAEVTELPLPSARRCVRTHLVRAQTSAEELALVAAWARETLARDAQTTVGIVAPALNRSVDRMRTQFQAAFDDFDDIDGLVNLGGGGRLAGESVCRDALRLIEWSLKPLHFEIVAALLRSRFVRLTADARAAPSPSLPTLFDLRRYLGTSHQLAQLSLDVPPLQHPSAWGRHFRRLLLAARWHDIDLGRRAHEARRQFDNLLLRFGEQDPIVGSCTGAEAFRMLKMIAATRTFAERASPAPVQVLSREDCLGLTFDQLWVLGADDANWPGPPDPNPFLPAGLQKDAQIPRATHEDELRWAREITSAWLANAGDVTFSYAQTDAEAEREPSRLLPQMPLTNARAILRDPLLAQYRHPYMRRRRVNLESRIDDRGSRLEAPIIVTGGVSVLRDQSVCPFRGYAIHRLELVASRHPHSLPDALDRGVLAHDAAARLFSAHRTSTALLALSTGDISAIAARAVDARGADWPDVFRERETARLTSLLEAWLQVEGERSPFEVKTVEGPASIDLGGLEFRLRPDRRDHTDDGQVVVIDFKTSPASIRNWRPPRPREPQLPMYATAGEDTSAAAFAQLVHGAARLIGVADDMSGLRHPKQLGAEDYESLKAQWRDALLALADEYREGFATVAPQSSTDCRNCHLHSLCRVFEAR